MSSEAIVITSRGAVTPVGLSATATCAALRAGIARLQEIQGAFASTAFNDEKPACGGRVPLEWFEGEPVAEEWPGHERFGAALPPPRHHLVAPGVERVIGLAMPALQEALAEATGQRPPQGPVGLYLGVDELEDGAAVLAACCRQMTGAVELSLLFAEGRAAGLIALAQAIEDLRQGTVAAALVGGVDSLIRTPVLARLLEQGLLQSPAHPQGIVPGEAAAFLFLETAANAAKRGLAPRAEILAATQGEEPTVGSEEPNQAVGLTRVLRQTIQAAGGLDAPPLVVCDLNGDRYRTMEWAFASLRTIGGLHGEAELWHPADCLGDCGAASGPLNLIWAAEAFAKGYGPAARALIWGASDNNRRAAAMLAPAPFTSG